MPPADHRKQKFGEKSWAASLSQVLQKLNYYCGVERGVGPVHYHVTFMAKPLGLQIRRGLAVKDVQLAASPRSCV